MGNGYATFVPQIIKTHPPDPLDFDSIEEEKEPAKTVQINQTTLVQPFTRSAIKTNKDEHSFQEKTVRFSSHIQKFYEK
jgi:hypothetical protein